MMIEQTAKSRSWETDEPRRVVVKLREGYSVPEDVDVGDFFDKTIDFPLASVSDGARATRFIKHVAASVLNELQKTAAERDPEYTPVDFRSYVYVEVPRGVDAEVMASRLRSSPRVETAYVEPPSREPTADPTPAIPTDKEQGYLKGSFEGVNAQHAWTITGGDGAGVRLIDVERGWTLDHPELAGSAISLIGPGTIRDESRAHGTSVLGVICAAKDGSGITGIAPATKVEVASVHNASLSDAMTATLQRLDRGDVLLIEQEIQVDAVNDLWGPVEVFDHNYVLVRLATALGIVVVEAGGNGNQTTRALEFDNFTDAAGRRVLRTATRDSGAILVSAATSAVPHKRLPYAPHGERIDCYAWGEDIVTCSSDDNGSHTYARRFAGTSGAAAIIAGVAASVQGMAIAKRGQAFEPRQLRRILRTAANGTTPVPTDPTKTEPPKIGVMPNLRFIARDVLAIAPDIFIRDHAADTGSAHAGSVTTSPDIIVRATTVANPQTAFGTGSGTENGASFGSAVQRGQDHFIYVRVLNRGGSAAVNVVATVYLARSATLTNGDQWTRIGSVTIPSVPKGSTLKVSAPITWPAAQIPAAGTYTLVAIIGHDDEPAPAAGELNTLANFDVFLRANNNVARRDVNVVAPA